MKKEKDLRFIRTREMIKTAFFDLIDSIGFENITVQNLSEKAMINRSTFYLHYADKYDLMDKIEDEMLDKIKSIIITMPLESFGEQPIDMNKAAEILTLVYSYIKENRHFFELVIVQKGSFIRKFSDVIKEMFLNKINLPSLMDVPEHYLIAFIAGIHTGLMNEWLVRGTHEPPEEMAGIITRIALGISQGFTHP